MAEYVELNLVIEALTKIAPQTPFGKSKTVAKCIDAVELLPSSPHIPPVSAWAVSQNWKNLRWLHRSPVLRVRRNAPV